MCAFKLNDLMFFVKSLKAPTARFNIYEYAHFAKSSTRSASSSKLIHAKPISSTQNHMPTIDLSLSTDSIKTQPTVFL